MTIASHIHAVPPPGRPVGVSPCRVDPKTRPPAPQPRDRVTLTGAEKGGPDETGKTPGNRPFSFRDILDIINPLQHIPIIGTLYRAVTRDEIRPPARILGGGIFGGIVGALAGAFNAVCAEITGKDLGEHLLGWLGGGQDPPDAETAAREADAPPDPPHLTRNAADPSPGPLSGSGQGRATDLEPAFPPPSETLQALAHYRRVGATAPDPRLTPALDVFD